MPLGINIRKTSTRLKDSPQNKILEKAYSNVKGYRGYHKERLERVKEKKVPLPKRALDRRLGLRLGQQPEHRRRKTNLSAPFGSHIEFDLGDRPKKGLFNTVASGSMDFVKRRREKEAYNKGVGLAKAKDIKRKPGIAKKAPLQVGAPSGPVQPRAGGTFKRPTRFDSDMNSIEFGLFRQTKGSTIRKWLTKRRNRKIAAARRARKVRGFEARVPYGSHILLEVEEEEKKKKKKGVFPWTVGQGIAGAAVLGGGYGLYRNRKLWGRALKKPANVPANVALNEFGAKIPSVSVLGKGGGTLAEAGLKKSKRRWSHGSVSYGPPSPSKLDSARGKKFKRRGARTLRTARWADVPDFPTGFWAKDLGA